MFTSTCLCVVDEATVAAGRASVLSSGFVEALDCLALALEVEAVFSEAGALDAEVPVLGFRAG